jgi:hypothetical protein
MTFAAPLSFSRVNAAVVLSNGSAAALDDEDELGGLATRVRIAMGHRNAAGAPDSQEPGIRRRPRPAVVPLCSSLIWMSVCQVPSTESPA